MRLHMTNGELVRIRRLIKRGVTSIPEIQAIVPVHVRRIKEVIAHADQAAAEAAAELTEVEVADVKPQGAAAKAAAAAKAKKGAKPNPIS